MSKIINKMVDAARKYSAFDFAIFKITLILVGIILGTYLWEFFVQYINITWILALSGVVYLIFTTLTKIKR